MREEFHGINNATLKQLYGWNTLNTNIWLPSLSELVGYDLNNYQELRGCYASAMQGLNASKSYWADTKGGTQFAYFLQYNASGGGQVIWNVCAQEETWLRSPYRSYTEMSWSVMSQSAVNNANNFATYTHAVHPAV